MLKKFLILIQISMVLLFCSISYPEQAAANSSGHIKPHRVREIIGQRTAYSTHYLMSDGSEQAVISLSPQHYKDSNGKWLDIVPKFIDEADITSSMTAVSQEMSDKVKLLSEQNKKLKKANKLNRNLTDYRALQVPYDVKIPKNYRQGYSVGKGKDRLNFKPVDVTGNAKGQLLNDHTIQYNQVWKATNVQLKLLNDGVKESLILKNAGAPKTFSFEVKGKFIKGLTTAKLRILAATLRDAKGITEPVKQVLRKQGNKQYIDLTLDLGELHDLTYPIVIDPSVKELTPSDERQYDSSNDDDDDDDSGTYIYGVYSTSSIGYSDSDDSETYRTLLKFDLSSISGDVSDAKLQVYQSSSGSAINVGAYMLKGTWPNGSLGDYISSASADGYMNDSMEFTNMKTYVDHVLNGNPNDGIGLKTSETTNDEVSIYSLNTIQTQYQPKLIITYANPKIEKIMTPTSNQYFSKDNHSFAPSISVTGIGSLTASYTLDSSTTPQDPQKVTNAITAQDVSFPAMDIGALSEGKHTFHFTVSNGQYSGTKSVDFYVDKTAPDLQNVSFTAKEASIQISGSATDGGSGIGSNPYRMTVGSSSSGWTGNTSYTKTGLTPNISYTASFEARDNVGLIAKKQQTVYTLAQTPEVKADGVTTNTIRLSLQDSNPSTTTYAIKLGSQYVNESGAFTATPAWISLTNKQIIVNGLAADTNYSITVQAQNGAGIQTSWSPAVSAETLALPPQIHTQASQQSMTISWSGVSSATGYDIEADGAIIHNGTSTSYQQTGLSPNTAHKYRVRVINAGGTGPWSAYTTAYTLPDPPPVPGNIQTVPTQTNMTVTWDSAPGAAGYDVEAEGNVIDNGNSTTYVQQGLKPLTSHTYRVRAKNAGGTSAWSTAVTASTLPYPPATPAHLAAQPDIHQVMVTWDPVSGADRYEIEADGAILDNGTSTTYVQKGLDPLSGHTYRVRAVNAGGMSPWSSPLDVTTHPEIPNPPANIMTTADTTSITVTWYKVAHADHYDIEIDGTTVVTVDGSATSYPNTGLAPDSKHKYRVRADNISGKSNWSSPVTMLTLPKQASGNGTVSMTNIVAVVTNTAISLSWDAVAPNADYEVEADGVLEDNGSSTLFQQTNLTPNQFHTYRIRMVQNGVAGDWIAVLALSTLPNPPDAPTNLTASATDNSIELKWDKSTGATGYDVEIDGKTVDAGDVTTYLHDHLASGTSYTYRVRAKNVTGVTAWSPALVKSTTNPDYTVQATQGQTLDFTVLASNVQDFSEKSFVVTYNPEQFSVKDLSKYTPALDTESSGNIPGTNLSVTYTPGKIVFTVNQSVEPGTSWSGEISTIVFKSKIDGQASIKLTAK